MNIIGGIATYNMVQVKYLPAPIHELFVDTNDVHNCSIQKHGASHIQIWHTSTVEPVLEDQPIGHKNVVCQDRWSLVQFD